MMTGPVMKPSAKPDARRFESRRDDLFIATDYPNAPFFLFFSGAGVTPQNRRGASTRAAEKQKVGVGGVVGYKQAIPTGFEESRGRQTPAQPSPRLTIHASRITHHASRILLFLALVLPATLAPAAQIEIPTLQWGDSKRPDGTTRHWNPKPLIDLGATLVSVAYRPLTNAEGKAWYRVGMTPPKLLVKTLENTKPELDECHQHGIKVIGYADTIMFHADMLNADGIDAEDLYATNRSGVRVVNKEWDKGGVGVSCISNPKWVELQKQVAQVHAKAGFDGLQFDVYPYAIEPGYQCRCSYCEEGWKKQSKNLFGTPQPMPGLDTGKLDYDKPVDRAFKTWRLQEFADFVKSVETDIQKSWPKFMILMNHGGGTPDFTYEAVHGALRYPTTELWHIKLGDDSSLYLYNSCEAANGAQMIGLINFSDQCKPFYRYRVALAEAYGAGGVFYMVTRGDGSGAAGISHQYCDFFRERQDWFNGTRPDAEVAVLYSWRDQAFLQGSHVAPAKVEFDPKRIRYQNAAAVLARMGVAHDCVIVEKGLRDLANYRVVVAPHLVLVTEQEAKALENYVRQGGSLLVVAGLGDITESGQDFKKRETSLLTQWTGKKPDREGWTVSMGKGHIAFAPRITPAELDKPASSKDQPAIPPRPLIPEFQAACDSLELSSQLGIKSASAIECTVRAKGDQRAIHLIRFGPTDDLTNRTVVVDYKLPARSIPKTVSVWSPDVPTADLKFDWKQKGDRLQVNINKLETYALVGVALEPDGARSNRRSEAGSRKAFP